jgi:hypothetical protein
MLACVLFSCKTNCDITWELEQSASAFHRVIYTCVYWDMFRIWHDAHCFYTTMLNLKLRNITLQHPVTLSRPGFWSTLSIHLHLWLMFTLLFIVKIHYMLRTKWQSSSVQVLQCGPYKATATAASVFLSWYCAAATHVFSFTVLSV